MLRLAPVLLGRLARAPRWAPVLRRGGTASGEEELFVFPEYEPEPSEAVAAATAATAAAATAATEAAVLLPRRERKLDRERRKRGSGVVEAGRPDPSVPLSGVSCSGCGAELHCRDSAAPGFMPAEKFRSLSEGSDGAAGLRGAVCQRCWMLAHYGRALRLELPAEQHRQVVSAALRRPPRHGRGALLLYLLDVLELPDPVLSQLPALLGPDVPVAGLLVVGNKVDLLPADSPGHLGRLRQRVAEACAQAGLREAPLVDIRLVSAKTGFGMEGLISRLQRSWKCAGDVYLLGATNSGKSTLFNTLLHSDYCKSRAPDIIDRATVSSWPGTTLNLLKFPIINPTCDRIFRRQERLKEEAAKTEDQLSSEEKKLLNKLKKQAYLVGRVGRTFGRQKSSTVIDFDPDMLSYSIDEDPKPTSKKCEQRQEFTYNEVKDARWCYDTPGIVKENCVLNLLTDKEVKLVLPTSAIVPRTFILKPGTALFLAALGRVDYLEGEKSAWFSVVASNLLPVHVTSLSNADAVYKKHAGHELLKVPMGGEERMKEFPPLVPQDITLKGVGTTEAVADIKLSSAGWVAVTAHPEEKLLLRAYSPQGTTLVVREPPLLPYISTVRGPRIPGTAVYRTKKPPSLVENLKTTGRR
ncbi:nitric oxide-associated protein 1 [Melopsittacus undulatus]|uniref:Nitric oxide associated 1 n=1 Tax=Melopsittacus undulatus TaxID=13146 RepID=A0A8C6IKB6_MELUD|nr:nitric oxide-associated protein 1 [Melopsittacus undulatus]